MAALQIGSEADALVRIYPASLIELAHRAKSLSLRRKRIRSRRTDAYRSPFKGRGMEYDESRLYYPGDDVRHLDWRVMARTGKVHTKLFCEERERPVYLWVDYRAPMFFATQGCYKSIIAAQLAVLVAWSAFHDGDRVGGIVFSDQLHHEVKPQRGKKGILRLIHALADLSVQSHIVATNGDTATKVPTKTYFTDALTRLSYLVRPGSTICLVSDFRGLDSASELRLRQLAAHSEMILIQVYDPVEAVLPPAGEYQVSDGDTNLRINTGHTEFVAAYKEQFQNRMRYLQLLSRKLQTGLIECRTCDNPFELLSKQFGAY